LAPAPGGGSGGADQPLDPSPLAQGQNHPARGQRLCARDPDAWYEANRIDYTFGLARNARLEGGIADALDQARGLWEQTNAPARVVRDFLWSTKDSWSRRRRVIAKAEWTRGEANPRFLVTSLKPDRIAARPLY
jgi:hypothetical protein